MSDESRVTDDERDAKKEDDAPRATASGNEAAATNAASDSGDPIFEALWKRVTEAWDDDKAHAALLDHAIRAEKLPDAAGRYRALKGDPEKRERAQKKLDAIVIAATQMLYAMKTPPRTKVPWQLTAIAFVVCLAILFWLARLLLGRH